VVWGIISEMGQREQRRWMNNVSDFCIMLFICLEFTIVGVVVISTSSDNEDAESLHNDELEGIGEPEIDIGRPDYFADGLRDEAEQNDSEIEELWFDDDVDDEGTTCASDGSESGSDAENKWDDLYGF
jgi:hypothetical protein